MSGDGVCGRVTALDEPRDQPQDEEIEEEPLAVYFEDKIYSGLLDD